MRLLLLALLFIACFAAPALAQTGPAPAPAGAEEPKPVAAEEPKAAAAAEEPKPAAPGEPNLKAVLDLLLQKKLITQEEYDAAMTGKTAPVVTAPGLPVALPLPVRSKWEATLYGFAEFDAISDSTQSFNEVAGNNAIAKPDTYAARHGRFTFSVRDSRLGFKISAPEFHGVKASAVAEMDFLGNQPPTSTEAATFTSPTFRLRHFMLKIEDPYVDVLIGQYWALFGSQPNYFANTVQILGIPGEPFGRAPQLRLSHLFKGKAVSLEIAAAAVRPPERDSWVPDVQAAVRLLVNGHKTVHTVGSTGTVCDPLSFSLSGLIRRFDIPEFSATPKSDVSTIGWGVSADAFIPIIPATLENRSNALSLMGTYVRGEGIADQFAGLTGGVAFPALPNPTGATPAPVYAANIDGGLVTFGPDGVLRPVGWQTFVIGLHYYLPPNGKLWAVTHYAQTRITNASGLGLTNKAFTRSHFFDFNVFWDATSAVRFGFEYSWFQQTYQDNAYAKDHRFQLAAFYIF
jgi:hypothetical protein